MSSSELADERQDEVMPEQLTTKEAVVLKTELLQAKPGYHLVVFEKTNQGSRYLTTAVAGELFQPSWFTQLPLPFLGFPKSYEAFHVTADEHLKLRFEATCRSLDGVHELILNIVVKYRIRHPEQLVTQLDRDPLAKIRDETQDLFVKRVRKLDWSVIKLGGEPFTRAIAGRSGEGPSTRSEDHEELRRLAQGYGIDVVDLAVDRILPAGEIEIELFEKKARGKTFAKARGVIDRMIEVFEDALSRSGEGVSNLAELKRAIHEVMQIRNSLPLLVQPFSAPGSDEIVVSQVPRQLPTRLETDPVSGLLDEIGAHFSSLDQRFRRQLTSAALHLLAEALLDGQARAEDLELYRSRLEQALTDEAQRALGTERITLLRRLMDTDTLKQELQRLET